VKPLRKARESRGYTLPELSAVTGISFGHLARVERGAAPLSADHRIRIIRALDLTAEDVQQITEFAVEVPA
jgi:transcriptional regulator with XRE-family HTH domain